MTEWILSRLYDLLWGAFVMTVHSRLSVIPTATLAAN